MFQKILVQIDPSRPLVNAHNVACRLAKRLDAELIAMYIVDEDISHVMGGDLIRAMDTALGAVGADALKEFESKIEDGLNLTKTIGYGSTADVISRYVSKHGVDLVVTGGYHNSVYTRIPFGSIVSEIVRKTPAAVLLHRDNHRDPLRPGKMVVPYDGSKGSRKSLHGAAAFADMSDQSLDVVHVRRWFGSDDPDRLMQDVQAEAPKLKVPVETHVLPHPLLHTRPHAILKHAKQANAPLIALSQYGKRTALGGLSPTVERLVIHTDRPLLLLHG